jgi:uncharacterized protein
MTPTDRTIAEQLKRQLLEAGVPVRVVRVYGSRARENHSPDSDLDVFLVLERSDIDIERCIEDIAWEVGFAADRIITTVEVTVEQLEDSPLRVSPFYRNVMAEGVLI